MTVLYTPRQLHEDSLRADLAYPGASYYANANVGECDICLRRVPRVEIGAGMSVCGNDPGCVPPGITYRIPHPE